MPSSPAPDPAPGLSPTLESPGEVPTLGPPITAAAGTQARAARSNTAGSTMRARPPTLRANTMRTRPSAAAAVCSPTPGPATAAPALESGLDGAGAPPDGAAAPRSAFANTASATRGRSRHVSIVQPLVGGRTGAPGQAGSPLPSAAPTGRARANTVSVSIRPRAGSATRSPRASADAGGTAEAAQPLSAEVSPGGRPRSGSIASVVGDDDAFEAGGSGRLNDDVVGLLDVVDPTVGTVNHLQNMTNSVIFPHFPQLWSRRPELVLPETPTSSEDGGDEIDGLPQPATAKTGRSRASTFSRFLTQGRDRAGTASAVPIAGDTASRGSPTPASAAGSSVALHDLGGGADADAASLASVDIDKEHALDAHVKHVLGGRSKWDTVRRTARGVWAFVKTPMGAFTAIYGFLVAFWGAAIVLFLVGWIPTSSKYRQDVWVEISSQVENGLFTLTGVGLIPWRLVDTYRMSIIHTLKMKTIRLRKQQGLPPIDDPDDLPDPAHVADYISVLTPKEQETLRYQQEKFAKSQTWYRPHATSTHRAFPVTWALWNTILMDGNSFFQCLLCGCMWGMSCLIPFSFLCGIGAAVLIWQGSVRTKKKDKVEGELREALGVPTDFPTGTADEKAQSTWPRTPGARRRTVAAGAADEVPHREPGKRRVTVATPGRGGIVEEDDEDRATDGSAVDGSEGKEVATDVLPA